MFQILKMAVAGHMYNDPNMPKMRRMAMVSLVLAAANPVCILSRNEVSAKRLILWSDLITRWQK